MKINLPNGGWLKVSFIKGLLVFWLNQPITRRNFLQKMFPELSIPTSLDPRKKMIILDALVSIPYPNFQIQIKRIGWMEFAITALPLAFLLFNAAWKRK